MLTNTFYTLEKYFHLIPNSSKVIINIPCIAHACQDFLLPLVIFLSKKAHKVYAEFLKDGEQDQEIELEAIKLLHDNEKSLVNCVGIERVACSFLK